MGRQAGSPYRTRGQIEQEYGRWMRDILNDLLDGGRTVQQIAAELGASKRNVELWLRDYGRCPTCGHPVNH